MSPELLVPAVAGVFAAAIAAAAHRRVRPDIGARLLAVTITSVVAAFVPAIVVLAAGYVAHLPWLGGAMAWCRDTLGLHQQIPDWLGLPALMAVLAGGIRLGRVRRDWRRFHCHHSDGLEIAPSEELFAYTMPGPGGHIVVSRGLVASLDDHEMAIVVAHEQAHARYRHDRYVLTAAIAVALLPLLAPLQRRLRFALERWADEAAVRDLDVDRRDVAHTLAAVALSSLPAPAGAVGIGGPGVVDRVTALLDPPRLDRAAPWLAFGVAGVVAVMSAAAVQAHHLLPLLASLCPG